MEPTGDACIMRVVAALFARRWLSARLRRGLRGPAGRRFVLARSVPNDKTSIVLDDPSLTSLSRPRLHAVEMRLAPGGKSCAVSFSAKKVNLVRPFNDVKFTSRPGVRQRRAQTAAVLQLLPTFPAAEHLHANSHILFFLHSFHSGC